MVANDTDINTMIKEFVRENTFSKVATNTPLEFVNWIVITPEYQPLDCFTKTRRNLYLPINYDLTTQEYRDIILGKDQITDLINVDVNTTSFIMLHYIKSVLKRYGDRITTKKIGEKLRTKRAFLIRKDREMLSEYKNIKLPDEFNIRDSISRILNTDIKRTKDVKGLIIKFTNETNFVTQLAPYLQAIYTIREMKLERTFKDFLRGFYTSQQYKLYKLLYFQIEKTRRWSVTLLESTT